MDPLGFTLFDTAVGRCGLAWSAAGLRAVSFPEGSDERTVARLLKTAPGAVEAEPPPAVAQAIAGIRAHLAGDLDDLRWIALDHGGAPDELRRLWAAIRDIPPGETKTYGQLAVEVLGDKLQAQFVGQAMGRNPTPIVAPCHRVVGAGGKTGGFSAPGGVATKVRVLSIERARTGDDRQGGLFDALPLPAPLATAPR